MEKDEMLSDVNSLLKFPDKPVFKSNTSFYHDTKFPRPLTKEETIYYFNLLEQGNEEARKIINSHNLSLVKSVVNKLIPSQYNTLKYRLHCTNNVYDKDDLMSIGTMGLMKATDTFKLDKNVRFSSYAVRCIENEIGMYFREVGITLHNQSTDQIICEDKSGRKQLKLEDILSDETAVIDKDILSDLTKQQLAKAMEQLSDKEIFVIKRRYGFIGKIVDQRTIGKEMGCPQSYVFKIEKRALKKIQQALMQANKDDDSNTIISTNHATTEISKTPSDFFDQFPGYDEEQILSTLNMVNQKSKLAVVLHYGLNGNESKSLNEIALLLKDTKDNIRSRIKYVFKIMPKHLVKLEPKSLIDQSELGTENLQLMKI